MAQVTKLPVKSEGVQKSGLVLAEGLDLSMVEGDSGAGVDNLSMQDVALPYLYILQALSPVVVEGSAQHIDGARPGMLYNNVAQEVYEAKQTGIIFVPAYYERRYVEWLDRDKGGGWIRDYDVTSDIMNFTVRNDKGRPVMKEDPDHFIVETAYHYGLFYNPNEEEWQQCVIPLKSTALKQNKKFNNELVTAKIPGTDKIAPRWLFPYRVTTSPESKGQLNWFGPRFEKMTDDDGNYRTVSGPVYNKAKEFAKLIGSGMLQRGPESNVAGEGTVANQELGKNEVPF